MSCMHFCCFGAMLFTVNLLMKMDSTVVYVPCMLEHVCYDNKLQIWKICNVNWLRFVYFLAFTPVRRNLSK